MSSHGINRGSCRRGSWTSARVHENEVVAEIAAHWPIHGTGLAGEDHLVKFLDHLRVQQPGSGESVTWLQSEWGLQPVSLPREGVYQERESWARWRTHLAASEEP